MSVELISVLIAVLAIGVAQSGLILTSKITGCGRAAARSDWMSGSVG